MYSNVLVPLDGSPSSEAALDELENLTPAFEKVHLLFIDEEITGVRRLDGHTIYADQIAAIRREYGMDYLQPFINRLKKKGSEVVATVKFGNPVAAITKAARDEKIDLIVLGGKSTGWFGRSSSLIGLAMPLSRKVDAKIVLVRERNEAA